MFSILLGLGGLRLAPPWNLDTSLPSAEALDAGIDPCWPLVTNGIQKPHVLVRQGGVPMVETLTSAVDAFSCIECPKNACPSNL